MKLFVLGEKSGNPDDWSIWNEPALVLAETAEQALLFGNGCYSVATEVDMSKPKLLMALPEPTWGEDL